MAKAALVKKTDLEIQGMVMDALSQSPMPVTFCAWHYVEQLSETQLIIATPWYDSKGPRTASSALVDELQRAGVYAEIPMRRMYIKSPTDPLVRSLERETKEAPEGFLHILRHKDGSYSVVFAPLTGPGGPVPAQHFGGELEAAEFLLHRLRLSQRAVEDALLQVSQHGNSAIVARFTTSQLRRFGLAQARNQAKTEKKSAHRRKDSNGN
jgi:hypothetical protein